jgi:hypothetical protein
VRAALMMNLAYCFLFDFLLCLLVCVFLFFSVAFNTKKMMLACCEFVLGVFFFCARMSAEMKAMARTIICVCWFPFLLLSLCIISLWVFLLCSCSSSILFFCSLVFGPPLGFLPSLL